MARSKDSLPEAELRACWSELCNVLAVQTPEEAISRAQELQLDAMQDTAEVAGAALDTEEARSMLSQISERIETLRQHAAQRDERLNKLQAQNQALEDAGIRGVSEALSMIQSMEAQLQEMYQEKETTSRAEEKSKTYDGVEDTFEQLQRLLAREERLQRELGVTSSEEVIEMVRGLASQLDELYQDRDASMSIPGAASGDGSQALSKREQKLQNELGVSDPADIVAMVNGLVEQLEELYTAREKLSQVNLDDAESVIGMIASMEEQLEVLYADQARMSERGIDSIDQAISMIESMEQQLSTLYDERQSINEVSPAGPSKEAQARLREMEEKLNELAAEKESLQQQREALASGNPADTLERELGVSDPEQVVQLVQSMEEQLQQLYANLETPDAADEQDAARMNEPLLAQDALENLPAQSPSALNDMNIGIIRLDDEGRVRFANDRSTRILPGVDGSTGSVMKDRNFFLSIAPGANSSLFRGRFKHGVENDALDEQFVYTFIHPAEPRKNLRIRLFRAGQDDNWILMRPLSRD